MADRRTDETPLAPPRSLGGSAESEGQDTRGRRPVTERLTERVSGAVSSATDSVRASGEARRAGNSGSRTATATTAPRGADSSSRAPRGRTRRARLRMTHLDPWSVMKISFLLSVAFGIVTVIAVAVVWSVLGAAGVWDSINQTVQEVIGGEGGSTFDVENYVGTSRVMGFTMIVAVVDVILITAIATLAAFLYNLAAALLGGVEVTLAEEQN